jgi:hypothetical protein
MNPQKWDTRMLHSRIMGFPHGGFISDEELATEGHPGKIFPDQNRGLASGRPAWEGKRDAGS